MPTFFNVFIFQAQFSKASQLTGEEFLSRLDYYANAWLPARDLVLSALSKRAGIDPSGQILIFDQFAPWKVNGIIHLSLVSEADVFVGTSIRA